MRTSKYLIEPLIESFRIQSVLSFESIASILGTRSTMTIFRKLKSLDYCSSYSDAGRFYILKRFIKFDDNGLWFHGRIRFSQYGSLPKTLFSLIKNSPAGYFASELRELLQVKVHDALTKLVIHKRLHRQQLRSKYLYLYPPLWHDQLRHREEHLKEEILKGDNDLLPEDVKGHMCWLLSLLHLFYLTIRF